MKTNNSILNLKLKSIFFICSTLLVISQVSAQFYVPEHSTVTLNDPLVSQEQNNIINSSIGGNSTLIFNAKFPQQLISEQKIEIPNITINNSSEFVFDASLKIKGALSINASNIIVLQQIEIEGEYIKDENSFVYGHHLITTTSYIHPKQLPITNHQSITNLFISNSAVENSFQLNELFERKLATHHKAQKIICNTFPIPTPPPEFSC